MKIRKEYLTLLIVGVLIVVVLIIFGRFYSFNEKEEILCRSDGDCDDGICSSGNCKCSVYSKCELLSSEVIENPEEECARLGLEWKIFSNGCVDSCYAERNPMEASCTFSEQSGCDCGLDKCWNGFTCEDN